MVLSPVGDVDQRRQTSVDGGEVILAPVKRDVDEANEYPKGFKTELGRTCVLARMRGGSCVGE